jgi:hypothetical protein
MGIGSAGAKGAVVSQKLGERWEHPKLKELVVEASRALARLDADRLEELALSCRALNRDLAHGLDTDARTAMATEAKGAVGDMAVFSRVLEATRANLNVINRLRELRAGRLEYRELHVQGWPQTGSRHGDN